MFKMLVYKIVLQSGSFHCGQSSQGAKLSSFIAQEPQKTQGYEGPCQWKALSEVHRFWQ